MIPSLRLASLTATSQQPCLSRKVSRQIGETLLQKSTQLPPTEFLRGLSFRTGCRFQTERLSPKPPEEGHFWGGVYGLVYRLSGWEPDALPGHQRGPFAAAPGHRAR